MIQTKLVPTSKTALVTHKGCLDGTGAALVFIWAGGNPANILFRNPTGCGLSAAEAAPYDEVWFADLCPPDLTNPAGGKPWLVFDHHVSNVRKFYDHTSCVFDVKLCGTSLLARELGVTPAGLITADAEDRSLIAAIEAYDLGDFTNDRGVLLADLASTFSQEEMLSILRRYGGDIFSEQNMMARADGAAASRALYATAAAKGAHITSVWSPSDDTEVLVGVAVSPIYWKNSVAQAILHHGKYRWGGVETDAHVALIIDPTTQMASLRSLVGGPDCSMIAATYNGGGHAQAAGFKINGNSLLHLLAHEVLG